MKQVLQSFRDGTTEVVDVPCPQLKPGHVLIATHVSLISSGTERMLLEFGASNLLSKARRQPDKLRMVLDKIRTDGLWPTLERVRSKLDQPVAMGYCNVGTVIDVGAGVSGLSAGDRVVSNGPHAEVVCVPKHLCARVPDGVADEQAVFAVVGAIALQGIRLAEPTLGESFAVIGLGLVGLLAANLLRAHGCRVIGIDLDARRLAFARDLGIETVDPSRGDDPVRAAIRFSRGRGVDGVLIATSTSSHGPVCQAAHMSRKRGRVVLLGVAGLQLSRSDFFEKEISFRVSCSYGPGRYDPDYEQQGHDYPFPFVRWTEQRNFEAVLDMIAEKRISPGRLITHRFSLDSATNAYALLSGSEPSLGVILEHGDSPATGDEHKRRTTVRLYAAGVHPALPAHCSAQGHWQNQCHPVKHEHAPSQDHPVVGILGAGNFARGVLIDAFKRNAVRLRSIASSGGVTGIYAARKFGIAQTTTDPHQIIADPEIDAVVIATRHNTHADFVCAALRAGKHVFVEKPLAVDLDGLDRVVGTYHSVGENSQPPVCMVGFNRRFAPHVRRLSELLERIDEPKTFIMTVNAGAIPLDHWTQDRNIGGGRIIGEGCHSIDLLRFLCRHRIVGVQAAMIGGTSNVPAREDKMSFTLQFADGSLGTVHYFANGSRSFPKERLEVFAAGQIFQLDNYRTLKAFGCPGFRRMKLWRQDRGHRAAVQQFVKAVRGGHPSPIPFEEAVEVTRLSFDVVTAAHSGTEKRLMPESSRKKRGPSENPDPGRAGQLRRSA